MKSNKKLAAFLTLCLVLLTAVTAASAEGLKISIAADILPLKIGAQRGTVAENLVREMLGDKAKAQLTVYENVTNAIAALMLGKVDATVMDVAPAQRFFKANPGKLVILPKPLTTEEYAFAFSKKDTELCEQVSKAIVEMKADGSLDAIFEKYEDGIYFTPSKEIDFNIGAKGGRLILGNEAGFPPYNIKDSDGFTGIDTEICAAVAKKLDKELVIKDMTFDALFAAVNSSQVDMICGGLTVTEERKKNVLFSEPYENAGQVIVVKAEDYLELPAVAAPGELKSIEQLKTEKIAAQRGALQYDIALTLTDKSNILAYERVIDAVEAVKTGKARAVVMGGEAAMVYLSDPEQHLARLPDEITTAEISIGFKKGNPMRDKFDEAITELKKEGTINAIIAKYFADPLGKNVKPEDIDFNKGAEETIVMGTSSGYAPMEMQISSGTLIGIDIELCAAIAKKLGMELKILDLAFDALPASLNSGKVDFICAGYRITEERKKYTDFTIPYMPSVQLFIVREDDIPESLRE